MTVPQSTRPSRFLPHRHAVPVALVLLLFAAITVARNLHSYGSDLAPSYIGARLFADGQQSHLYAHDPIIFNHVADPAWAAAAIEGGMKPDYTPAAYVQTPLWAYLLSPLCAHISFSAFSTIFLALAALSFAALIWLIASHWTPRLFHPGWIALLCTVLYGTEAFRYAMCLIQTHILFVLLVIASLILARRHPLEAGTVLALAAAVKITPGLLVLYWLTTRQRKAAASFVVSSVALIIITVIAVGPALSLAALHEYTRLSNVLLVAFNNQSFAATWMSPFYPASELFAWHIFPLPTALKATSLLLSIAATIAGGLLDRNAAAPPFGAIFAMIGATIFATIAWSHYSVLLIVPAMLLLDSILARAATAPQRYTLLILLLAVVALNLYPFSYRDILMHPFVFHGHIVSIVRSQFYAGVLAMAGMAILGLRQKHLQVNATLPPSRNV